MKVSGELTLDEFKRMMDKTRAQKAELEKALDSMANWEEIAEQMEAQVERLKRALSFKPVSYTHLGTWAVYLDH